MVDEQLHVVIKVQSGHNVDYAYKMGNNHTLHFNDYKEAAKALMKRNFPDVLDNKQTEVIFIPETHLPTAPRVVDFQAYETKKTNLPDEELAFLKMKRDTRELANASLREI